MPPERVREILDGPDLYRHVEKMEADVRLNLRSLMLASLAFVALSLLYLVFAPVSYVVPHSNSPYVDALSQVSASPAEAAPCPKDLCGEGPHGTPVCFDTSAHSECVYAVEGGDCVGTQPCP